MKLKGKLIRWNEERGFGFINSPSVKGDVFIHISELKHMSRRPQINDVIYFDTITEKTGKTKAINATIEGVQQKTIRPKSNKAKNSSLTSNILSIAVILGIAFAAYTTYPSWSKKLLNSISVNSVDEDFSGFRCEGKQYCSEMTSCKEARFYLKNCPNVKVDGDNDGTPCESQWCN
jgi:cold shock CspA family protein